MNETKAYGNTASSSDPENTVLRDSIYDQLYITIQQELEARYFDLPAIIERTYRNWNATVREILRTETGLRLSIAGYRQSVPIRVVDGFPRSFETVFRNSHEIFIWELSLNRSLLQTTYTGLAFIEGRLPGITQELVGVNDRNEEVSRVKLLLKQLLDQIHQFDLLDAIMSIDEDTLGVYFFRIPVINIYWMPIGIVASILDISVESLTLVILAHELAHAYTHLGKDIDGVEWQEDDFAGTEIEIVEGLAQYYTLVVCKKIIDKYPAAMDAFDKLLTKQSKPYWSFTEWSENSENMGELVRYCLIRSRKQSITKYADFLKAIAEGKMIIGRETLHQKSSFSSRG